MAPKREKAPKKAPKKAARKAPSSNKKATKKAAKRPREMGSNAIESVPGPTDVEAYKGGGEGFSGRATFRLHHFGRAVALRDASSTFRDRFAKMDILSMIERTIRESVLKANVIRTRLVGRSWQVGCTIKVKYHGSSRWDIITGYTPNYPLTRPIRSDDLLRAYGHAISQTLASPEEIRIIGFNMLAWFRATLPQVQCLKLLNRKPVPVLYDEDGGPDSRMRQFQRAKRRANTAIIKTRFGI